MIKKAEFPLNIDIQDFDKQTAFTLQVADLSIRKDLIMLLTLLREELVDMLVVQFINVKIYLKLTTGTKSHCTSFVRNEKTARLSISINNLEYLMFFFLRYYRDGIAEASHIDLDFTFKDNYELTWTFIVDNFRQYSQKDLKRLLGE